MPPVLPFPPPCPSVGSRHVRSWTTTALFNELAKTSDRVSRDQLLEQVIVLNIPVAESIALRYHDRGIGDDDLMSVARLALVKAAQRFDVDAGHHFLAYAVPTIRGEIKRYFRDHGWMVRPPRRVQELQQRLPRARSELERDLGRSPRPSELAAHLDVGADDIIETLSAAQGCFSPTSLDELTTATDSSPSLYEFLGVHDAERDAVEARILLAPLVRDLSDRDRHVLRMRFFDGCTQAEIAADIGVTQMQVSRLLARILRNLRHQLDP